MTSRASSVLLTTSIRSAAHASGNWCRTPVHMHYSVLADIQQPLSNPVEPLGPSERYLIRTAIVLNRAPTLTRPPTAFEAAMHEYYSRIGRALFNPFPEHFYFKPGSLLKMQFNKEERQREKEAFNWKKRNRRVRLKTTASTESSPELAEKKSKAKKMEESSGPPELSPSSGSENLRSHNPLIVTDEEQDVIMPRITEADKSNDVRSLDRLGHRNLYLLIKRGRGTPEWRLPGTKTDIRPAEGLHELAERELYAECGINMDAWIVGRHPIGHMDDLVPKSTPDREQYTGCKIFFYKAHILAGQVDLSAGLADFAWLTKAEVQKAVTPEYWANIRDMLSDF